MDNRPANRWRFVYRALFEVKALVLDWPGKPGLRKQVTALLVCPTIARRSKVRKVTALLVSPQSHVEENEERLQPFRCIPQSHVEVKLRKVKSPFGKTLL